MEEPESDESDAIRMERRRKKGDEIANGMRYAKVMLSLKPSMAEEMQARIDADRNSITSLLELIDQGVHAFPDEEQALFLVGYYAALNELLFVQLLGLDARLEQRQHHQSR